jgi:hypothetical protein
MSQVASPRATLRSQVRHHRLVALSALLALLATTAVVLVLAIDGGSSDSVAQNAQPALRTDGGPNESAVAASIAQTPNPAPRTDGGPEESAVAASVSKAQPDVARSYVSESRIAAAIAGH